MSTAGLQVFDTTGKLILDSATNVYKKLGEFTVTSQIDGEITDVNIIGKEVICFINNVELIQGGNSTRRTFPYKFMFDTTAGKISWNFQAIEVPYGSPIYYKTTYEYGWIS